MEITIVRKDGAEPTPEDQGVEVWHGGYVGPEDGSQDEFPASILVEIAKEVEIGQWYDFESFKGKLSQTEKVADTWTEITVPILGTESGHTESMLMGQFKAAKMLMDAVLELCSAFAREGRLWIRVS